LDKLLIFFIFSQAVSNRFWSLYAKAWIRLDMGVFWHCWIPIVKSVRYALIKIWHCL